jgi:hypothetical protein
MTIVMNMSDYEIESEALEVEDGEEIMYAGWNPDVDSVSEQLQLVPTSEHRPLPDDLKTVAAELFLRKMYSYQH